MSCTAASQVARVVAHDARVVGQRNVFSFTVFKDQTVLVPFGGACLPLLARCAPRGRRDVRMTPACGQGAFGRPHFGVKSAESRGNYPTTSVCRSGCGIPSRIDAMAHRGHAGPAVTRHQMSSRCRTPTCMPPICSPDTNISLAFRTPGMKACGLPTYPFSETPQIELGPLVAKNVGLAGAVSTVRPVCAQ